MNGWIGAGMYLQINTHLIPIQDVFFEGQVFNAYELASRIIRSASRNIILIDNYIDESTLTHLSKNERNFENSLNHSWISGTKLNRKKECQ